METRDPCPICKKELHSIITRRVGEVAVCIDCGDAILPLMNAIANGIVQRAQEWMNTELAEFADIRNMRDNICSELDDHFLTLISVEDRMKVLASINAR